jgi:hypothetical protein
MYRDNWNTIDRLQEEHRKALTQEAEIYQLLKDEWGYGTKRRNLLVSVILWFSRHLIGFGLKLREQGESASGVPSARLGEIGR